MNLPKCWGRPTITYATDAYGGADADVSTETTLADIAFVRSTSQPTAQGEVANSEKTHGVSVKVKANSSGTTDNFNVNMYTSDDGIEWDTVAHTSFSITATGGSDVIRSVLVEAPARYLRVRGARSGSTDTFDVECTITPYTFGEVAF